MISWFETLFPYVYQIKGTQSCSMFWDDSFTQTGYTILMHGHVGAFKEIINALSYNGVAFS